MTSEEAKREAKWVKRAGASICYEPHVCVVVADVEISLRFRVEHGWGVGWMGGGLHGETFRTAELAMQAVRDEFKANPWRRERLVAAMQDYESYFADEVSP